MLKSKQANRLCLTLLQPPSGGRLSETESCSVHRRADTVQQYPWLSNKQEQRHRPCLSEQRTETNHPCLSEQRTETSHPCLNGQKLATPDSVSNGQKLATPAQWAADRN